MRHYITLLVILFLWLAPKSKNSWLFKELTWFQPVKQLFIVEPRYQQGIHCRFGMRSIIAEAHFDRSRNAISMMRGLRRWIMTPPEECQTMYILPRNHPSGRHSEVTASVDFYCYIRHFVISIVFFF